LHQAAAGASRRSSSSSSQEHQAAADDELSWGQMCGTTHRYQNRVSVVKQHTSTVDSPLQNDESAVLVHRGSTTALVPVLYCTSTSCSTTPPPAVVQRQSYEPMEGLKVLVVSWSEAEGGIRPVRDLITPFSSFRVSFRFYFFQQGTPKNFVK
jgi:hypothetical protein